MKKLILTIATAGLLFAGCCKERRLVPQTISDKYITSNRDGSNTYFHLLLSNGEQKDVDGAEYANTKVGDTYYTYTCWDDYK